MFKKKHILQKFDGKENDSSEGLSSQVSFSGCHQKGRHRAVRRSRRGRQGTWGNRSLSLQGGAKEPVFPFGQERKSPASKDGRPPLSFSSSAMLEG